MKILNLVGFGLMSLFATSPLARAQNFANPQQVQGFGNTQVAPLSLPNAILKVKFVPAHILAWYLDPAHNPHPVELEQYPLRFTEDESSFPGIERVIPVDDSKQLLIWGTKEDIERLPFLLHLLDQPIRRVELETHLGQIRAEDLTAYGVELSEKYPGTLQVKGNFSAALTAMIMTGRFKELDTARVTIINGQSTTVEKSRSRPAPETLQSAFAELAPQPGENTPLEVHANFRLKLAPTINNDNTITLLANPSGQLQLARKGVQEALPLNQPSIMGGLYNLKDGETLALSGFDSQFTSAFIVLPPPPRKVTLGDSPFMNRTIRPKPQPDQLVLFITARIVQTPAP